MELLVENLNVNYKNSKVIKDVSLNIEKGEIVTIVGPSGCGKSTLLSAIVGLKKPKSGVISLNDRLLFSSKDKIDIFAEERNIGYVFQNYALWPHMTVEKNIAFPLKAHKKNDKQVKEKTHWILNLLGLEDYLRKYPYQLSGGEKQRVALGRALVLDPQLLLLDEPMANIDAKLKVDLLREIKRVQSNLNISMIYVTHDQNEAFELADKIAVMNNGEIKQFDIPNKLYDNPNSVFVANFIGNNNIIHKCDFKSFKFCSKQCKKNKIKSAIGIRPEDIIISNNGEYDGLVKKAIYSIDRLKYIVNVNNSDLLAYGDRNKVYKAGDKIKIDIKRYHYID